MLRALVFALLLTQCTPAEIRTYDLAPQEQECPTKPLYHETRGEPAQGQRAVAAVVLNRVKSDRWPDSVCTVTHDATQFTWIEHFGWNAPMRDQKSLDQVQQIVHDIQHTGWRKRFNKWAHHYVSVDVVGSWPYREELDRLGQIDNHVFFE